MMYARALRPSRSLRAVAFGWLGLWCVVAAFPIFWIAVMSLKDPVDAFSSNPFVVVFGDATRDTGVGISAFGLTAAAAVLWGAWCSATGLIPRWSASLEPGSGRVLGLTAGFLVWFLLLSLVLVVLLPETCRLVEPWIGWLGLPIIGLTTEHYIEVWIHNEFYRNFVNSMTVTVGVVAISLTIGTLAGFGLARSRTKLAFWILIVALVFRALPHSVLVAGYLPVFINSSEILRPFLGDAAPTLYGRPLAVIVVLVAINQPFTIWMLRSFFANIPAELDESARVDGCTYFQAFRLVIIPVMWPGVITAGLFSFLVGYNDFLVTSLLLDAQNQTMVPAITGFFNRETTSTDQVRAVAAAVSITAPLFLLVMVFQRQIISGLTAGAVKG